MYAGPGASPTQATAEPFAADSPYFPFGTRSGSRLSPAKAKGAGGPAGPTGAIARGPKDEPQQPTAATTLDSQQWTAVVSFCFDHYRFTQSKYGTTLGFVIHNFSKAGPK